MIKSRRKRLQTTMIFCPRDLKINDFKLTSRRFNTKYLTNGFLSFREKLEPF